MKRLVALDMLRGYALICIMVDHMPLSAMRNFTIANYSIFDAAELFVLLSGFLVGLVWLAVERRDGRRKAQRRFIRRSFEVWRALVIGGLTMALLSAGLLAIGFQHTAVWNQYAIWITEQPLVYTAQLMSMWLQPNLLDVLAVYVILIASAPLLVPLLVRFPFWFAAGSVVLWWFATVLNPLIPNQSGAGLLFNPFGWQMLFYSGVAMGLFRQRFMPVLLRHRHLLTVLAAGMFLFGATIVIALRIGDSVLPLREALKQVYGVIDKWPLDGTRYLAIMAASWLVAVPLARPMEWLAKTVPGVAMQQIGRGGLWSFIVCVLLSVLGDALQMNPPDQGLLSRLVIDVWVILALWCSAALWLAWGAPLQKGR
ncbi:OpgC domain-containing protein [Paracoccus sp. (in: a-proteobacteria)]|uniref:OpgC domain-containing protein n=1 Tax=Paracoccus sp. TaxID=267 RepID=UPI003A8A5AB9